MQIQSDDLAIYQFSGTHLSIIQTYKSLLQHNISCALQIGSITLNKNEEGKSELLASQPGGTYVRLIHDPQNLDLHDDR